MHWSESYVGLPWRAAGRDRSGVDCWGLTRLVYQEVAGVTLDSLDGVYVTADEREVIAAIVAGEMRAGQWRPVPRDAGQELDVLVFRCLGLESHVGIVVGRGLMLHATMGQQSMVDRYVGGRWIPRLTGIWRHNKLA